MSPISLNTIFIFISTSFISLHARPQATHNLSSSHHYPLAYNHNPRLKLHWFPKNPSSPLIINRVHAEGPSQDTTKQKSAIDATSKQWTPKTKRFLQWLLGFLTGMLAGTLTGIIISIAAKLAAEIIKNRRGNKGPWIYSPLIKNAEDLAFLEKEDSISSLKLIGRGGCGEVYKAELPHSNGKMIAIKKIVRPTYDPFEINQYHTGRKMKQIRSEINTVSKLRHRNLVPLLAHVSHEDCDYLVYEFMKNGSLQEIMEEVGRGRALDWPARHRIALGMAAGLEYLHTYQCPRIVHRDLKPANILLDDEMEARIADFGLAKAIPMENTHASSSNVAGTVGYIAPEYHQTLKLTDRCDVYSMGVVLGVLVMGKLPSDEFFQHREEGGLVKWMRKVMRSEDPLEGVDPGLVKKGDVPMLEEMVVVLRIACFCTADDPRNRPSSKEVRCMLAQIR